MKYESFWVAILFVALRSLAGSGTTSAVATSSLQPTYTLLPTLLEYPTYTSIPNKSCIAFTSIFWHNYTDDRRYQ
jgi:hypothetical protein